MTKTSPTIVFFGNERLATGVTTTAPTLRALIKSGYNVAAVVSNFERGTSRSARSLEISEVAAAHNIPVLLPDNPQDITDQLREMGAEAGVLVAYGKIVPRETIDIFPKGIINIHPSLLPLHRGPTPIESVILDGSKKTGVSLMGLVKAMDSGPIYGQVEVDLSGQESKQELADKLLRIGGELLIDKLPDILAGKATPQPQDDSSASYDQLISKDDGVLDWNKPADRLEREIRAFMEWPKSRTELAGKEVIITSAHAVPSDSPDDKPGHIEYLPDVGVIMVTTGEGSLCIDKLKPAGKKEMPVKAFLAGYGKNLA